MPHAHEDWEFQSGWSAYEHAAGYTMTVANPTKGTLKWAVYEGTDTDSDPLASGNAHSVPAAFLSASLVVQRHAETQKPAAEDS